MLHLGQLHTFNFLQRLALAACGAMPSRVVSQEPTYACAPRCAVDATPRLAAPPALAVSSVTT